MLLLLLLFGSYKAQCLKQYFLSQDCDVRNRGQCKQITNFLLMASTLRIIAVKILFIQTPVEITTKNLVPVVVITQELILTTVSHNINDFLDSPINP